MTTLICTQCHKREVYGPDPFGGGWCLKCAEEEADYDRKLELIRPLAQEFMARARELTDGDDDVIGTTIQRAH